MLTILHTLESPVIESLGWALVHFVWQATLLAMLLAVVLLVLRKASSRVKYVVQCSVLLAMAACPAVTWWWVASTMKPDAITAAPHFEPVVPYERQNGHVEPVLGPMVTGAMGLESPIDADSIGLAPAPSTSTVVPQPDQVEVPQPDQAVSWNKRLRSRMAPMLPWFVGAWLLGVLGLSLRLMVGWRIVQRLKRLAVTPADAAWQLRLKALAARLGVTHTVQLVESALIEVPTVIGWIRPMILLPVSLLTSLTPQQLEAVLAHELAHIRRHDYLVNLIQTAIETLLFYHPAVWWLSRMIRAEREHCCDDLAVNLCDDPITYVSALAAMEELRVSPTLTMAATGGSLLNRIRRIALGPAHDSRRSIWWGASLIALLVIASLGVTTYIASHADDFEQKSAANTEPVETEQQAESDRPQAAAMEEFRGRVLNHLKKPVAGATVALSVVTGDRYEVLENTVATVLTDEVGEFRLSVLSSELKRNDTTSKTNLWAWTSDVETDGFGFVPLQPDQEQPIKMSLFRPMTEVVELAGMNGKPVQGTIERLNFSMGVNLILPDDLFKQVLPQPMVSGSFRILGFPIDMDEIDMDEEAGEEVVDDDDEEAKSPTRAEWRSLRIVTEDRGRQLLMWHPTIRKDVPTRLLMREPELLQGRLTSSSGILPAELLKQTEIVLESHDSDPGKSNLFRTGFSRVRCDNEGRFEVRDLPAGKLAISLHTGTVTGWSWRTPRGTDGEPLELSSGVVTNVEIPLIRTRTVRSQIVTQSGQPIPNVELNVSHATTRRKVRVDKGVETTSEHRAVVRTDERGEFSVDVVPGSIFISKSGMPGLGMLTAIRWPSDPAIALPDRGLRVDPDETPLQLPPLKLTVLTGRVIDHERQPYKGLIIAKGAEPDESFGLNYSRKDGTFRLEGIGEPSEFKVYSIENSNQIPFETPDTETTVISHNPLILQVTPKAKNADEAGEASLPNGLDFLKPYPKLHGLSLDMTEPRFLEIVKQQELKTRKSVDGEKVTHYIALGDGHSLVVMFDKDGKCGGIQRVRGEGKNADEKRQPQVSIQDVVRGVDFSKVKVHGHDEESLRQIPDLNIPDPQNPGSLTSPKNVFPMPLREHTWLMYPAGSGRFYIEHRPDGTPQSELIYGPIDGDPFDVLKLDDLFRARLKPGANEGDPRYRLTLMFRTGDPQLIRRAWRLIEPELAPQSTDVEKGPPDAETAARYSYRDEWRGNRLESLERVREALRDEAETFRKPELSDIVKRMRETVAAVEAVIDAINDSVPDESYQSATYLQPKIQAKLPDALWGKPVSGLRLGLVPTNSGPAGADWNTLPADARLPTSIIARPGEPLHYLLMVENVSDQEIKFSGYTTGEDIARSIEILDRHGKPVMYDSLHTTIPHTISHWRLKPGERKLFTMPAVYFHPAAPNMSHTGLGYHATVPVGRYSVRCSYYFGGLDKERHRHVPGKSQWIGKLTTGTQTITFGDGNGAVTTANAAAATPAVGLEFLKQYPKLHGFSLDMTEPLFLEIVKQQELKTRKTVDGENVTHHIELGDGHSLVVMFHKDGKCAGIQRGREDVKSDGTRSQPQLGNENISLYPRVFRGKITDANGMPVAQALIEWGPDYPHDAPKESVRSAEDGTYRFEVQKAGGDFKLGISAAGNGPKTFQGLVPGPKSKPTELDVQLPTETTIRIAIVDEAKQPIPDLEVLPMTPQRGFNSSFSMIEQPEPIPGHARPTTCNVQGVCQLRQLLVAPEPLLKAEASDTPAQAEYKQRTNQRGWLSLRITRGGKSVHEHAISRREFFESNGNVQIVVPDYRNPLRQSFNSGTIFGQVVDARGTAIANYHITLRHRPEAKAVSDTEGRFEWGSKLDPANPYEVRVFAKGFAPQMRRIVPNKTQRSEPERIELMPHTSPEFVLLDAETQKPIPNVIIVTGLANQSGRNYIEWNKLSNYADGHGLENVFRVTTDADGRFWVPEGDSAATLLILTPNYARTIVTPQQRPGRNEKGLMPLALPRGASIHGVAAKNSQFSQRASGVSLHASRVNSFDQMFFGLVRDANGECVIESLAAGDYLISLDHSKGNMSTGFWLKKISLKTGEKIIVPLGEMTGSLTLSGRTSPFTDVKLTRKAFADAANNVLPDGVLSVAAISDIDGNFELDQLEAGDYSIEIAILQPFSSRSFGAASKGPQEIKLTENTYIDFTTGTVRALGKSELVPNKNATARVAAAPTRSQAAPGNENIGLEFLKPYPKLHGLSLDMTEPLFLEIVKQQELKATKVGEGDKTAYRIGLGDGLSLIVMFRKDGTCRDIQRVRGEYNSVGNFSGRVTGPDGKPLSRARVFVLPWTKNVKEIGAGWAETDAEGRFEFDALDMTYSDESGRVLRRQGLLIATADGFAADWMRTWGHNLGGLRTHSDPVEGEALELRLAKDDVPIHGRFLNHDGQPLAGASVKVEALMIPLGRDLDAHLKRYSQPLAEFSSPDYERELYHERVQLLPGVVSEVRTDADGRFRLSGFGRDRLVTLKVSAPSVIDTVVTVMTRDGAQASLKQDGSGVSTPNGSVLHGAKFTQQLQPGRTIKGRVIDRETRQPVAGMWVGPRQNAIATPTPSLYPWITDDAGCFTIFGLSPSNAREDIAAIATPGLPYSSASVMADGKTDIVIETSHGIPFRLKLVDEQKRPVDAEVSYTDVHPNPHVAKQRDEHHWPVNRAARKVGGVYEGFVWPGPGAVLVKLPSEAAFRPARVDPKAFFAPGRADWTAEEAELNYGNTDELVISQGVYRDTLYRSDRLPQKDYAAIILVNPQQGSGTLELSAVVATNATSSRSDTQLRDERPQRH